jgi:hypothetical protein
MYMLPIYIINLYQMIYDNYDLILIINSTSKEQEFFTRVETTIPASDLFPHPTKTFIVNILNTQN